MRQKVRPADIIRKYYSDSPLAWQLLLEHSRRVCRRALKIARGLNRSEPVDCQFVAEATMLHDIGMILTDTPALGCFGNGSYLTHGIRGRELLEKEGLPHHALVCERHIGIGLTAAEILEQKLDLPARDMLPETLEEQIICYADLYFSKNPKNRGKEKSPDDVRRALEKFGREKVLVFDRWLQCFEPELSCHG